MIVLLLIFISIKYFQNGNLFSTGILDVEQDARTTIEGKPDAESIELAELYRKETRKEIDPRFIVPTGKAISDGVYSYKVESWMSSKEDPGYPLPKGMESLKSSKGVEQDENGTITNQFSFLTVNILVENLSKERKGDCVWGYFDLEIGDADPEEYDWHAFSYLGEKNPREYRKNYYQEIIEGKGKVIMPLIYVIKDELLEDNQLFIRINRTGMADVNIDDKNPRRCIVLN